MHLDEAYSEWQKNSLWHMRRAEDWKPVWIGFALLVFLLGLVFLRSYWENQPSR